MSEEQAYQKYITTAISPKADENAKKTHIQDKAIASGKFVVINGYHANLVSLKRRFDEGGYRIHETKHLQICMNYVSFLHHII